jgi:Trypsin-co-occurring domain 1
MAFKVISSCFHGLIALAQWNGRPAWGAKGRGMTEVVEFKLPHGGVVYAEVAVDEPGVRRAARTEDGLWVEATAKLDKALEGVRSAANVALDKLQSLSQTPDEIELAFGVRLNATAGAVLAKTGAEGHLQVRLVWTKPEQGEH